MLGTLPMLGIVPTEAAVAAEVAPTVAAVLAPTELVTAGRATWMPTRLIDWASATDGPVEVHAAAQCVGGSTTDGRSNDHNRGSAGLRVQRLQQGASDGSVHRTETTPVLRAAARSRGRGRPC
jgi:hypothetical protein